MIDKQTHKRIMKCLSSGMSAEDVMRKFGVDAMNDVLKRVEQIERSKAGRIRKQNGQDLKELFSVAMSQTSSDCIV